MNENLIKTLNLLGLDEKQSKVYLACLELGGATVQEISEKSGVNRTTIYHFLSEMKNQGFFTEIKEDGKTFVIPEDPKVLLEKGKDNLSEIEKNIPEFMGIFNLPSNKPKLKFYQGIEGMKAVNADLRNEEQTVYGISDYEKMFNTQDEDILWTIPQKRAEKKIKLYCIAKDGPKGREVQSKDKEHYRETKLVKDIKFETEINIYGNKVHMVSFRRPYACVLIEDPAIAQTLKSMWKSWWKTLK